MRHKYLLHIFFLIYSIGSFGQDFAPIEAEWHYTKYHSFSGDIDYYKIESVKDTLVNDKSCKKLIMNFPLGCTGRGTSEFVYEEDSVVYFYCNDFAEFQILYSLKVKKDSSWLIKLKSLDEYVDSIFVSVDSTDYINMNDRNLILLYVTYNVTCDGDTSMTYSSKVIEKIGDIHYLFNLYPTWSRGCDFDYSGGLRCYEDPEFGFYSTGFADSCTYTYTWTTNVEKIKNDITILKIYPNPTINKIQLESINKSILTYYIYDYSGKKLKKSYFINATEIDISDYPKGIYIISIKDKNTTIENKKIIKY